MYERAYTRATEAPNTSASQAAGWSILVRNQGILHEWMRCMSKNCEQSSSGFKQFRARENEVKIEWSCEATHNPPPHNIPSTPIIWFFHVSFWCELAAVCTFFGPAVQCGIYRGREEGEVSERFRNRWWIFRRRKIETDIFDLFGSFRVFGF